MTITREQQKQILIDTANHVISRDNTSPYSENLRELARIALASLEAEPIGAFHIADQQVGGTSDYIKDGEWPIDNGVIEVYAAPPCFRGVEQPQNARQNIPENVPDGNSPAIPDDWVMVPKEPTQAMIKAWLSEVANFRGHAAGYKAALAAAPQREVK
ncbi:hypothetical protein FNI36_22295 [Salmonella enterica subsp. diarizonae]|nr:hypothetical protein [Salmonella enterica subsp. diarizonae]